MIVKIIFWIVVGLIVYVYLGYPLLLLILSKLRTVPQEQRSSITPTVSIIIPVYNEKKVIAEKIENSLTLDYPRGNLEIIVASDGSTDGTNEIVKTYISHGVKLFAYDERSGKTATLNSTIPKAQGSIIVFTDANTIYKRDALRQLVKNFSENNVGCVCGAVHPTNTEKSLTSAGLGLYIRYETFLKGLEEKVSGSIFAYGAIYAIRKKLFNAVDPTLADDFVVPLDIAIHGWKCVQELKAVAYEKSATNTVEEFRRIVRMVNRDSRAIFMFLPKAIQQNPIIAWQLFSHKLLRWLIGLLQLMLFVVNLFLLDVYIYRLIYECQIIFYIATLVGFVLQWWNVRIRLISVPYYFCIVNSAALLGIIQMFLGKRIPIWEKAQSSR